MWVGILITALVAMLMTIAEHWMPWKEIMGRDLPRPAAYILGTLAILIPVTVLVAIEPVFDQFLTLIALWAAAAGAGMGTIIGYIVDDWLLTRNRMHAAEAESRLLRPGIDDDAKTER